MQTSHIAKTLINLDSVSLPANLLESVRKHGIISPLIACDNILVDGHKRLKAGRQAGLDTYNFLTVKGIPALIYADMNHNRVIETAELVQAFSTLNSDEERKSFVRTAGLSESPQMMLILTFLARNFSEFKLEKLNSIPVKIWRELAHIGLEREDILKDFVNINATVGEKRLIAGLLRQAARKKALPSSIKNLTVSELVELLQHIVQPRKTSAIAKFNQALEKQKVPAGVTLKIDQNFDQPGIEVSMRVKRNRLEIFDETRRVAEKLFAEVDEL
ncbi:MAG: hypothetical protein Kow0029_11370 [Candidatus Rifleibacteriota bacterium]